MTKHKFCTIPWTELYSNSLGNYGLCCMENVKYSGSKLPITAPVELHWNSDYMKSVRQRFVQGGDLPECNQCWAEEDAGKVSVRNRRNLRYVGIADPSISDSAIEKILNSTTESGFTTFKPLALHFSVGSVCQLRCIQCSPSYSRSILKDYEKLGWNVEYKNRRNFKYFDAVLDQQTIDSNLWNNLKSFAGEGIEWIQVTGGEPNLSKPLFEFLQWCIDNDFAKNISIVLNSNGVNIKSEFLSLLEKFKLVLLNVSVDGVELLDEYIRYPTKWEEKEKNITEIMCRFPKSSIVTTVSSLNVNELGPLVEWSIEKNYLHNFILLTDPESLSVRHLPNHIKYLAKEKLSSVLKNINSKNVESSDFYNKTLYIKNGIESVLSYIDQPGDTEQWEQFLTIVEGYDKIRSFTLKSVNSDLI